MAYLVGSNFQTYRLHLDLASPSPLPIFTSRSVLAIIRRNHARFFYRNPVLNGDSDPLSLDAPILIKFGCFHFS